MTMFRKILIANRGEIACRVIATARRMGIATVAVYSEADAQGLHVALADEAYPIGQAPARQSYLRIEALLEAAHRSGAEAVHPGYGFLAENAAFAEACTQAGLVFIGPPAASIRAMGSKAAAKALMGEAGVPVVPGYHGDAQDSNTLTTAAASVGYPVLIKASAGGGGKGMRIVTQQADLPAALDGARREAEASFGDGRLLIERYLTRPRHIEIQIFADTHGHCVSLFERDCSIQRRHQKVLEEAPAFGLTPEQRRAMGDAAIAAARAIGYVGAGTVEFIAEAGQFFFMEMNTRLQVEHPVTEMVTGTDLVEWQLVVAAGGALPLTQAQLALRGHAIEARIYAEDPSQDYRPSIGTLTHLRQPVENATLRVETGVRTGDAISPHYDPMIAKLIVWGEDRDTARRRLAQALAHYEVAGVQTNIALLRAIADHPAYAAAELDTGFLHRHAAELAAPQPTQAAQRTALAAAALWELSKIKAGADPWSVPDAWRLGAPGQAELVFAPGGVVRARPEGAAFHLELLGACVIASRHGDTVRMDGVQQRVTVVDGAEIVVILDGRNHSFTRIDALAGPQMEAQADGLLSAPIPARVARVLVTQGERVAKGAPLLVLEAMKMELTLSAPRDGVISEIRARADQMVAEGVVLVVFADEAA
jgi:3-methylcrotonyl-CoA carboxylase alpha subunit